MLWWLIPTCTTLLWLLGLTGLKASHHSSPGQLPSPRISNCFDRFQPPKLPPRMKKNPFGLCEAKLIPVTMHIHAANKNNIKMMGTIILWFYDSSIHMQTKSQADCPCYGWCWQAILEPGELRSPVQDLFAFPNYGWTPALNTSNKTGQGIWSNRETNPCTASYPPESALSLPCNCPHHQLPLPRPTQLPFPAIKDNLQCLKQCLLNYYKSNVLDACELQLLLWPKASL